jgi:hypothetical protein
LRNDVHHPQDHVKEAHSYNIFVFFTPYFSHHFSTDEIARENSSLSVITSVIVPSFREHHAELASEDAGERSGHVGTMYGCRVFKGWLIHPPCPELCVVFGKAS